MPWWLCQVPSFPRVQAWGHGVVDCLSERSHWFTLAVMTVSRAPESYVHRSIELWSNEERGFKGTRLHPRSTSLKPNSRPEGISRTRYGETSNRTADALITPHSSQGPRSDETWCCTINVVLVSSYTITTCWTRVQSPIAFSSELLSLSSRRYSGPLRPSTPFQVPANMSTVTLEVSQGIATITFNSPERLNAINREGQSSSHQQTQHLNCAPS